MFQLQLSLLQIADRFNGLYENESCMILEILDDFYSHLSKIHWYSEPKTINHFTCGVYAQKTCAMHIKMTHIIQILFFIVVVNVMLWQQCHSLHGNTIVLLYLLYQIIDLKSIFFHFKMVQSWKLFASYKSAMHF